MKPKVALVKDGFLPPGSENTRGRMSKDAIARCEELALKGWSIDGFSVAKPSADTSKPATVERVATDPNRLVDVPDMVRDPRDWEAYDDEGKKFAIGIKGCCENCRNSVTYCRCQFPVLRVDNNRVSVVTFKPIGKKGVT